jgi:hypothetical protein
VRVLRASAVLSPLAGILALGVDSMLLLF